MRITEAYVGRIQSQKRLTILLFAIFVHASCPGGFSPCVAQDSTPTSPLNSQASKTAEAAESQGEAAAKQGELNAAIAKFNEAIQLDPKYALAYSNRGLAYGRKLDFAKALADATKAIRLDPKSSILYDHRGVIYFDSAKLDSAIIDYTAAILLEPKLPGSYIDRAQSFDYKGDYEKAMDDARTALRLAPDYCKAHNAVGIAFDSYARAIGIADEKTAEVLFERACDYFDRPPKRLDDAEQELPFDGSIEHFRATAKKLDRAHKMQLLFDYSAQYFRSAIEIQPDYDFGQNNLGVYYARRNGKGDVERAERYFRASLQASPRYPDAFNNLGIVLARQGKFDEAISAHKAGLAIRDNRTTDHNNLSRVFMQKGELEIKNGDVDNGNRDLDNALNENNVSIRCDPNFLGAWLSREEICFKQKKVEEAGKCVERMISINRRSPETRQAAVFFTAACIDLHRPEDAIQFLNQLLKSDEPYPELYNARGLAYYQKGDLQRAKEDLERVIQIFPQFPGGQERLELIRKKLADPGK